MAIVDYQAKAESDERVIFRDERISEKNKETLRKFLKAYDVSPARKGLFLRHITFLLRATKDITQEMHNRDFINNLFSEFRTKVKPGYYATIVNVSLAFTRWLNDGERPQGFKDIKNVSKKKQQRNLSPNDMTTWQEGLELSKKTKDVQIRAMLLVQLDAGFRPSEFIELNYGDVKLNRELGIVTFTIKEGKTGGRIVPSQRCFSHIAKWLDEHPTKKADSPLWIDKVKEKYVRYKYDAIRWHFITMAERLGFKKPVDFYALRHSSCVLDKLDNLPVDVAAERHGHSVKFFVDTYGRLSTKDKEDRFAKHYDMNTEEDTKPKKSIICHVCQEVNDAYNEYCSKCHRPLNLDKALQEQDKMRKVLNFVELAMQGRSNEEIAKELTKNEKKERR